MSSPIGRALIHIDMEDPERAGGPEAFDLTVVITTYNAESTVRQSNIFYTLVNIYNL